MKRGIGGSPIDSGRDLTHDCRMASQAVAFGEQEPRWRLVQAVVLVATAAFVVTVALVPEPSLALFWNVVVPVLPLSFLVTPVAWRSVCPLATLNTLASRRAAGRRLDGRFAPSAGATAIVLLALLVPARHLAFNTNGIALAAFILCTAAVAVIAGRRYTSRAGFCNSLCPILPVERLYGQQPLVSMASPRCATCASCTPRGCLDVAGDKTLAQVLGRARRSDAWLLTAFGLFASAFPGFIVGYFSVGDAPLGDAPRLYAQVLAWAAASVAATHALVRIGRMRAATALALLAGVAAGSYNFLALPAILRTLGAGAGALGPARLAVLAFVGWWTGRAVWRSRERPTSGDRSLPVLG
jgi:nitrite reductase (NADH) large subunit